MSVFKQLIEITTYQQNGKRGRRKVVFFLMLGAGLLFFVLPVVFAIGFMIYYIRDEITNRPKAEKSQIAIEQEFRQIKTFPNAILVAGPDSTYKTDGGVISSSYKTPLTYSRPVA